MKTITTREHDLIASVIGEGLTALAEAVIEKDLLVTEVLRKLTEFGRRVERRPRCANLHNGASHAAPKETFENIPYFPFLSCCSLIWIVRLVFFL